MAGEKKQKRIMYYGEHDRALDPQCRVSLPSEWRNKDGETELVMIPASGSALVLMPQETLANFFEKLQDDVIANPKLQKAFAAIGSLTRICRCDKQGRLALDRKKLESIGVDNQLKMLGAITHIRICAPQNWQVPEGDDAIDGYLSDIRSVGNGAANSLAGLLGGILKQ